MTNVADSNYNQEKMKNIIQVVQVSLNSQQLLDMVMQESNLETNAAITNLCER